MIYRELRQHEIDMLNDEGQHIMQMARTHFMKENAQIKVMPLISKFQELWAEHAICRNHWQAFGTYDAPRDRILINYRFTTPRDVEFSFHCEEVL